MAFKIEKFGAEVSNAKSILGGISYYRYAMTNNDDITTAGYFPSKLGLKEGDRIWVTPKVKTDADALYIVSNVSDAGVVTVVAAPSGVDESKIIIKSAEIPTADAESYGKIYCYDGATSASYTHGYIYECQKTAITYIGTVSFEAATLSGTTVACSGDDFAQFLTEAGADPTPIVSGTMTYDAGAGGWRLVGKDAEDNTVTSFLEYNEDYADAGFTFTGTPVDGDVIAFTCTVEEDTVTYGWVRIDVQPQPAKELPTQAGNSGKYLTTNGVSASWAAVESLPDQTGQSGKFLTTNGSAASWGTISALQNTATGTNSLTILGTAATESNIVNIGVNATAENGGTAIGKDALCVHNYGTAIGMGASVYGVSSEERNVAIGAYANAGESSSYRVGRCVVIGSGSRVYRNGSRSVIVGDTSYSSSNYGVAIGCFTEVAASSSNGIAIGFSARVSAANAIQIGSKGANNNYTNSDANTFKVGNANGNFEMMSADGTIPAARHASLPAADGTYVLKLTISGGVPTLAWVVE